ncbi:type II toxin-antitoxin system MqsA family antitoxin [Cupriavidus pauculus]
MKCPECGGVEMTRGVRDLKRTYGAATMIIENVAGDWCPLCGGGVID